MTAHKQREGLHTRIIYRARRTYKNLRLRQQRIQPPPPPEPQEPIGDPRQFTKSEVGGGAFGYWTLDRMDLPAYVYTMNQYRDPRAAYPNSENIDRRDHWHQIGNNRITGLATNDGYVQAYIADRGGFFFNRFEAGEKTGCFGLLLAVLSIIIQAPLNIIRHLFSEDNVINQVRPDVGRQLRAAMEIRSARTRDLTNHAYAGGFGYVHDGEQGWCTAYRYRPLKSSTARIFGMGYYETTIVYRDIRAERIVYAPAGDDPIFLADVLLRNESDETRTVRWYEYWDVNPHQLELQWLRTGVFAPVGDAARRALNRNFTQTIRHEPAHHALRYHMEPPADAPPPDKIDKVNYYPPDLFLADLSGEPSEYFTSANHFFGDGGAVLPDAVKNKLEGDPPNAPHSSDDPYCFVLCREVTLAPGESTRLRFAYGAVEPQQSLDFTNRYRHGEPLQDTAEWWKNRLAYFTIGNAPELQREMAWHAYYLLSSTIYNRFTQSHIVPQGSAYLYLHGADGASRDHALEVMPLAYIDPQLAKETLRAVMRWQTADDDNKLVYAYSGHGVTSGAGIHEDPSDLDIFFLLALYEYLSVTGDMAFLDEELPYYPPDAPPPVGFGQTVLDHVRASAHHLMENVGTGEQGLIRLSDGDWSDGVVIQNVLDNPLSYSYSRTVRYGESIPNTQMALYVLPRFADLIEGRAPQLAQQLRAWAEPLRSAVQKYWNGRFYARAILRTRTNQPAVIGDDEIDLEAQPWALISDLAAQQGTEARLIDSIDRILDSPSPIGAPLTQRGMVWPAVSHLLTWGYTRTRPELAWRSLWRHSFFLNAWTFPDIWFGIWSGPDGINGINNKQPGYTWSSPVTPVTDFPVMNNNQHGMMLLGLLRVCGIEPAEGGDGLKITPKIPHRYKLDLPMLALDVAPGRIAGEYRAFVDGERTLYIAVPDGAQDIQAQVDESALDTPAEGGYIPVSLQFITGQRVRFAVTWQGGAALRRRQRVLVGSGNASVDMDGEARSQ